MYGMGTKYRYKYLYYSDKILISYICLKHVNIRYEIRSHRQRII
jgi:hypothetical protein